MDLELARNLIVQGQISCKAKINLSILNPNNTGLLSILDRKVDSLNLKQQGRTTP